MSVVEFSCPCKLTQITAKGDPAFCIFCWCNSCQRSQSAPCEALGAWPESSVTISGNLIQAKVTDKFNGATRFSCARCGTRMSSRFGEEGKYMRALFPAQSTDLGKSWFKPGMHIFCEDSVVIDVSKLNDGLPKYADVPASFGGSDRQL